MNDDFVIVVEGKSDEAFINSFLDAEIVTTNGSEVSRETIEYLKTLSEKKKIIVLTDPDSPGKRIRDVLDKEINGLYHVYVPKEKCIKHNKVGIAESDKETILEALGHPIVNQIATTSDITFSDLLDLGLVGPDSNSKREELSAKLHLGHTNGKTLLKRLWSLGITLDKLKEIVNGRK